MKEDIVRFGSIFLVAFFYIYMIVWQYRFQKETDRLKSYLPQDPFTPLPEPPDRNYAEYDEKAGVFINAIDEIANKMGYSTK